MFNNGIKGHAQPLAGQVGGPPLVKIKSSDQTVNNSANNIDITDLELTVKIGEKWIFKIILFFETSTTADIRLGFSVAGASSDLKWTVGSALGGTVAGTFLSKSNQSSLQANGGGKDVAILTGIIDDIQDDGEYSPQFSQLVAEVSDTKILSNSYVTYRRVQ